MRTAWIFSASIFSLCLAGCGTVTEGSGSATDSGTDGTDSTTSVTTGGSSCMPGSTVPCACPTGGSGQQTCNADGGSYGECVCGAGTDSGTATSTTGGSTTSTTAGTTLPTTSVTDTATTGVTTATTTATTGVTTATTTATTGLTTATTGPMCDDPGPEPNEVEDDAVDQGDLGCDAPAGNVDGILDGGGDLDWNSFSGIWTCGAGDPVVLAVPITADPLRLCAYAQCNAGNPQVTCLQGVPADSPDGRPGCCQFDGAVEFGLNCLGTPNESSTIFMSIEGAGDDACVDYEIDYSF